MKRKHVNTPRLTNDERADMMTAQILDCVDEALPGSYDSVPKYVFKDIKAIILKGLKAACRETLARKKRREG